MYSTQIIDTLLKSVATTGNPRDQHYFYAEKSVARPADQHCALGLGVVIRRLYDGSRSQCSQ